MNTERDGAPAAPAGNSPGNDRAPPFRAEAGVESEKYMEITSDYLAQAMSLSTAQSAVVQQTDVQQQHEAVKAVNQSELLGYDNQLVYARDPLTRQNVIKVVSRSTGDTVGQLPPEIVVQMAAFLDSK